MGRGVSWTPYCSRRVRYYTGGGYRYTTRNSLPGLQNREQPILGAHQLDACKFGCAWQIYSGRYAFFFIQSSFSPTPSFDLCRLWVRKRFGPTTAQGWAAAHLTASRLRSGQEQAMNVLRRPPPPCRQASAPRHAVEAMTGGKRPQTRSQPWRRGIFQRQSWRRYVRSGRPFQHRWRP